MRGTTAVLRVKVASSYPATRRSPIMSPSWPHLTICLSSEHVYSSPPAQAHAVHLKMGRQSTRRVKEGKPVKRTRVKNERVGRGCRRDSSGVGETGQAHMSLCPLAFSETSSRILHDRQLRLAPISFLSHVARAGKRGVFLFFVSQLCQAWVQYAYFFYFVFIYFWR